DPGADPDPETGLDQKRPLFLYPASGSAPPDLSDAVKALDRVWHHLGKDAGVRDRASTVVAVEVWKQPDDGRDPLSFARQIIDGLATQLSAIGPDRKSYLVPVIHDTWVEPDDNAGVLSAVGLNVT